MTKIFFKSLLIILVFIFVTSCSQSGPPSTKSYSSEANFNTLSNKIIFLEQYVKFRRTYNNLDFNIFFQNNSGGLVPGPSDWDIQLVAKIPKSEIKLWVSGLDSITSPNIEWMKNLPSQIDLSGISVWYSLDNRLVGVDERNSVIVYRNTNM